MNDDIDDPIPFEGPLLTAEELRASLERLLHRIEAGEEELIPHEVVVREMRAKLAGVA